jgi:hypothetical protein
MQVSDAITELSQLLLTLDQQQINKVPFEGSWTAAQVAEHLLQSYNGLPEMLSGPTMPIERAPDKWVAKLKEDFLNFSTKMKAPDFIVPADTTYDRDALLASLSHIRAKIVNAINTHDPNGTPQGFSFPGIGRLTRLELSHFTLYHTQRHIHQLKRIVEMVK